MGPCHCIQIQFRDQYYGDPQPSLVIFPLQRSTRDLTGVLGTLNSPRSIYTRTISSACMYLTNNIDDCTNGIYSTNMHFLGVDSPYPCVHYCLKITNLTESFLGSCSGVSMFYFSAILGIFLLYNHVSSSCLCNSTMQTLCLV